jgi:hypothetical protein
VSLLDRFSERWRVGAVIAAGPAVAGFAFLGLTGAAAVAAYIAFNIAVSYVLGAVLKPSAPGNLANEASDRKRMVKQPITPRRVIYGSARVSGPIVFEHTTDDNKTKHLVIVLASHELESIGDIYFDDDFVTVLSDGRVAGQYLDHVWVYKHLGGDNQTADTNLINDAPDKWTADHRLRGLAYLYVRLEFDRDALPSIPNISAEVKGRKVFDPRNGQTRYSTNPALCLRDFLKDLRYGLKVDASELDENAVRTAANICDEAVALDAGGTEKRYEANGTFNLNRRRGEIIEELMSAMAGQLVYSGGQFRMLAGAWRPGVVEFTEADLRGPLDVQTRLSQRDRFNSIKGMFVSPAEQWEPTDFPARSDSGYVTADQGEVVWMDLQLPYTTSHTMAQRIARIHLERSRQEIVVNVELKLRGLEVKAGDVVLLTNARMDWSKKPFEIQSWKFRADEAGVDLVVQETASQVFDWNSGLEFGHDIAPNTNLPSAFTSSPPTNVQAVSDGSTILQQTDGSYVPRIRLTWTEPADTFVDHYEIELRRSGTQQWQEVAQPLSPATSAFLVGVEDDGIYDVRIRSVNNFGVRSTFVTAFSVTANLGGPPFEIDAPTNVAVAKPLPIPRGDGSQHPRLIVTWTPPVDPYLAGFDVQTRDTQLPDVPQNWQQETRTGFDATSYQIQGVLAESLSYDVRVRAFNTRGVNSSWTVAANAKPRKKDTPPPDVTGMRVIGWPSHIDIAWDPVEIDDLSHYEIRRDGNHWDFAFPVATTKATEYQFPLGEVEKRQYVFRAKAVTTSGVESALSDDVFADNGKPTVSIANPSYKVERGVVVARFSRGGSGASWWRLHASKQSGFQATADNSVAEGRGFEPLTWAWDDSDSWGDTIYVRLSALDQLTDHLGEQPAVSSQVALTLNPAGAGDVWRGGINGVPIEDVLGLIGDGGRMDDARFLLTALLANLGSIQISTGVLTAVDAGSTSRIDVAAHSVRFPGGDVAYNAGSISGLLFDTDYYIIAEDAGFDGGTVTYQAFQLRQEIVADRDWYYVGSIRTPTDGGGPTTGGGGAGGGDIRRLPLIPEP